MTSIQRIRESLARVTATIERDDLDAGALKACGDELSALGAEISTAIETEFLMVAPEPGSTAA